MTYATPKHVFLHLLMIAMLYISVIAFITLYWQYANQIFFDSALIVAGFFIAGMPAEQRSKRLDDQRVNNLMEIQNHIVSFVQTKAALPIDQTAATDWSGQWPVDPETQTDYSYIKLRTTGYYCFDRTIGFTK